MIVAWGLSRSATRMRLLGSSQSYRCISVTTPNIEKDSDWSAASARICTEVWMKCFEKKHRTFSQASRLMEHKELWETAYWKACRNMGHGLPKGPLPSNLAAQLEPLREACLTMNYDWGGTGTLYLTPAFIFPTKLPEFQDQVVQEVLLMFLEPMFEPRFSDKSFGLRPGRSAVTALRYITGSFQDCTWFMTGDLTSIVKDFEPKRAIKFLHEVVKDEKIISLVSQGLTAKRQEVIIPDQYYLSRPKKFQKEIFRKEVHQGRPKPVPYWLHCFLKLAPIEGRTLPNWGCCKLLSPFMLNIYLHKLDLFMEELIQDFASREDSMKMEYIRYAAHFLVGIKGTREDAVGLQSRLQDFCHRKLHLKLLPEIYHVSQQVPFLGHLISTRNELLCPPGTKMPKEVQERKWEIMQKKQISQRPQQQKQKLKIVASMTDCIRGLEALNLLKLQQGRREMKLLPCMRLHKATQGDANEQISNLLHLLADFYKLALNRKKVTIFLAFVFRSALAIMFASKHKLGSRAKVYKRGGFDLSVKITGKKGVFEYARRRIPLPDTIAGIPYRYSKDTPPPLFLPITKNWHPHHENCLNDLVSGMKPETMLGEIKRYREADSQLQHSLVDTVMRKDCAKPVSDILVRCNDD